MKEGQHYSVVIIAYIISISNSSTATYLLSNSATRITTRDTLKQHVKITGKKVTIKQQQSPL
jgi:hypothetical protein